MESSNRKVYEIPVHEVAGFLNSIPHAQLLSAPVESFPPEYQYLIYIYRNAWLAPRFEKITEKEAANAAIRFHSSLRSEMLRALPDERELKKKAFVRTHQLCIRHQIIHPVFNFNRKGRVGGDADGKEIRMNLILFRENVEEYLSQVIPHELAHHLHFQLGLKGRAHGKEWKNIMIQMGVKPDRCHRMDTTTADALSSKQFYIYSCACLLTTNVAEKRHKAIQAMLRTREVLCLKCKKPMGFDGIDRTLLNKVMETV